VSEDSRSDLLERARRVCEGAAGPAARDVDRDARFPAEAVEALRKERLLGIAVPRAYGGEDASLSDVAAVCRQLAGSCASTAMIYAMHQIQVACLVRHGGDSAFVRRYLGACCERQLLIASATSEIGVGGDIRTSRCAVEPDEGGVKLEKQASVVSYGAHCDAILATARRHPEAAPSDQVAVLLEREHTSLTQLSAWDTLGMRGTCSCGFTVRARASAEQVLPHPFERIAAETMHPVSHLLWAHVWLGIAGSAVASARRFVRAEARKKPGTTPPGALRVAELVSKLDVLRGSVRDALRSFEQRRADPEALSAMRFQIHMNGLKVSTAEQVPPIVLAAMGICGIASYRNDTEYALGQKLRDALGAGVMIANDRLYGNNAMLLLVSKED
jgi:acyl-CoA dehydrogenase